MKYYHGFDPGTAFRSLAHLTFCHRLKKGSYLQFYLFSFDVYHPKENISINNLVIVILRNYVMKHKIY